MFENFKLVTQFMPLITRDFAVSRTLVDPHGVAPLLDGEWLQINDSYAAVRYVDDANHRNAGAQNAGLVVSFPMFAERGRYDVQALAEPKIPLLFANTFEADTKLFSNAGLFTGCQLEVFDMTYPAGGSVTNRRGLRLKATGFTVGYVTRIFTDRVRFIRIAS